MQRNLSAKALNSDNKQQKAPQIKGVKSRIDCRWAGGIPKPIRTLKEESKDDTKDWTTDDNHEKPDKINWDSQNHEAEDTQVDNEKEEQFVEESTDLKIDTVESTDLQAAFSEFLIEKKSYSEESESSKVQPEDQAIVIQDEFESTENNLEPKCNVDESKSKVNEPKEDEQAEDQVEVFNIEELKVTEQDHSEAENQVEMHAIEELENKKSLDKDESIDIQEKSKSTLESCDPCIPSPVKLPCSPIPSKNSSLIVHLDSIISPILSSPHPLLKSLHTHSAEIPSILSSSKDSSLLYILHTFLYIYLTLTNSEEEIDYSWESLKLFYEQQESSYLHTYSLQIQSVFDLLDSHCRDEEVVSEEARQKVRQRLREGVRVGMDACNMGFVEVMWAVFNKIIKKMGFKKYTVTKKLNLKRSKSPRVVNKENVGYLNELISRFIGIWIQAASQFKDHWLPNYAII